MAAESVHLMKSTDLIKKELLDYGGFGEVYLCYHKTLGHVVQKNVYTGPPRNGRQKQSLLEEGSLMSRLNHPRIVKLLGIILEDGDYSLVMELIPRGNLHSMLEAVTVPLSLKARFVVEIMEGMIYLTENQVVHKDLKPENILVDKHFHLKIADLGLATSETWSKLTREESRRQSRLGKKPYVHAAGTLCYIAPEHLESIHTRSTEKSDVYSFAIVVWVILTGREPYENAIKEEQIYLCVCQGERPNEELIPPDTPPEIIDLMKTCWQKDPDSRPTFRECHRGFLPFYKEKLEACVEEDLKILLKSYEGPEDLLEKLKSLTTLEPHSPEDSSTLSRDSPTTLKSSDLGPVEASIEDLSFIPYGESQLEIDAAPPSSSLLEIKLAQEYNYHKYGSRIDEPEFMYNPLPRQPASSRWPGDVSSNGSSVKSWTKFTPDPNPEEEVHLRPAAAGSLLDGFRRSEKTDPFSLVDSDHDRHQHPQFDRMRSCPESGYHRADPVMLDSNPQIRCSAPVICPPSDSGAGTVFISNAEAIQIGSHNTMNLRTFQSNPLNSLCRGSFGAKYSELLSRYEDLAIAECHLEIVRQNVGSNWKRVARRLGLTDIDVETIEHDYDRDGLAEKVHQMLEFWKKKEGIVGFTVGNLCRALDGCIKPDVIRQLLGVS